jgi:hypothetical protein
MCYIFRYLQQFQSNSNPELPDNSKYHIYLGVYKNTFSSFSQELLILTIAIISEYIPTNDNTYKNRKGEIIILNSVNMELISK